MKWIRLVSFSALLLSSSLTAVTAREAPNRATALGLHLKSATNGGNAPVVVPHSRNSALQIHTQAALSGIRGGGSIDPKLIAATAGASILSLYGTACVLSPDEVIAGYGVSVSPVLTRFARNAGTLTCSATFVLWSLLYSSISLNRAVGIAAIPYVLRTLYNIVTQSPAKMFGSHATEYIGLTLSLAASYAMLANDSHADLAMKAFGLVQLLVGLFIYCFPEPLLARIKHANGKQKVDDILPMMCRNHGDNLLINGAFFTALAFGYDIFKSFAYTWFVAAAGMGGMVFVTKDIPRLAPTAVGPTKVWVAICFVIASVMMFG